MMREGVREMTLRERFEAASEEFAASYFPKARLSNSGIRFYSSAEFLKDLHSAAGDYDLFAAGLWTYFRLVYVE
jgi:hypothetical protein